MAHHAADPNQDHDFEVIDLSPFFTTPGAAKEKEEAIRRIREACSDSGMFLIVNHGVPAEALDETLAVAREFFAGPDEEKLKWSPRPPEPGAAATMPMEVMERTFEYFVKTVAPLIETLINDALGLPPDLLRQYNSERQWDVMLAYHYFKATETKKVGSHPHKDPNLFTVLLQDDVGGLEFLRGDGEWIPVSPVPHSLIVNVGDVVQVLSNGEFKSVAHRVVSPREKDRYSLAFGYQIGGEKWVEPFAELTGQSSKAMNRFQGFHYHEFLQLLGENYKLHLDPNDAFAIMDVVNHYALPASPVNLPAATAPN
ncbi:unnamed protein product [Linum tenue]|uniref:Fe2OG dioxygenase domain-containing protein n=1 Tax=Linum tenue TaxID=586396 RepID=A0AAV0M7R6_9ROSI|nr:unnamed protein product [Linum tenue]